MHVGVIGGGIVGIATSKRLVAEGHRVTLFEPGEIGGPQNATFGNGALISSGFMVPIASPGLWRQLPGFLTQAHSPVSVRWRDFPARASWCMRFLAAGATKRRQAKLVEALAPLVEDAPQLHQEMSAGTDATAQLRDRSVYFLYPDQPTRDADTSWTLRAEHGRPQEEIARERFHQDIGTIPEGYSQGASLVGAIYSQDNSSYLKALLDAIPTDQFEVLPHRVEGFDITGGRITHLCHDAGKTACDTVVVCAGWASGPLAEMLGDRVPLGVERGYSLDYPDNPMGLQRPLMLADKRIAVTPQASGVRVAGQVEIAAPKAPEDPRHFETLHKHASDVFPALSGMKDAARHWMGRRPSMIDCRPVIGRASGVENAIYGFGHGHIGLTSAPRTAALVADILANRPPNIPLEPYAPQRFR